MFIFDANYLLFVFLPTLVLSLAAQFFVQAAFSKWSQVRNGAGVTGVQVAEQIMRSAGLGGVRLEGVPGTMSDHYDPQAGVVRLSQDVATRPSVAAMAIVAHEFGHVQQHQQNSVLITMRNFLVPAMRFSPMVGYGLIMIGLLMRLTNLIYLGALFFGVVVIFMLLTLPVEIDASRRGLALLRETGLMVMPEDASGAQQVLTAAALTYVAAFVTALLQLLYYLSLAQRRR
ncbi:MAG: zinc metallopeptidase [Anaerolineae bacterium]